MANAYAASIAREEMLEDDVKQLVNSFIKYKTLVKLSKVKKTDILDVEPGQIPLPQ